MAMTSGFETITGVRTEVLSGGQGRTLLFLHGALGLRHHETFLAALATAYRVIAPAHPGFGETEWPREFRTIDDLAYFHLELADHFTLDDAILVGSCLGGWIAAEMLIRSTSRFSQLVLVNALGCKFGDRLTRDITDIHALPQAEVDALLFDEPDNIQTDLSTLSDDDLTAIVRAREAFTYFGWKPYMHNPALRRWLHRIDLPTLVLWGSADGFVRPDYGRKFAAEIPSAQFEEIPAAGHFPTIEQPQALAAFIRDFAENRGVDAAA